MREQESYEELQARRKKIRKRLLICAGALLLVVALFFGTVLFLQIKVRCSYDELADSIRVTETGDGELLIEAEPKLYPDNDFEPSGWTSNRIEWKVLAIDEENETQYCSVILCGSVKRGEKWFGEPTRAELFRKSLSPAFPHEASRDDNNRSKYRDCICEVYYLEWELPGWDLLTYGEPMLLWSRDLPDGVTPFAEPQKYRNPYITVEEP